MLSLKDAFIKIKIKKKIYEKLLQNIKIKIKKKFMRSCYKIEFWILKILYIYIYFKMPNQTDLN